MTAKRWPVLDTLRPNKASFCADTATSDIESSALSVRVGTADCSSCCSIGLTPGVPGLIGVDLPECPEWPSSERPPDTVLGASNKDPLPSVVSRDSASSSDSIMLFSVVLLLLAAYIRGAPMGQYMAMQFHRIIHSCARMPATWRGERRMRRRVILVSIHSRVEAETAYEASQHLTTFWGMRGNPGTSSRIVRAQATDWSVGDGSRRGNP